VKAQYRYILGFFTELREDVITATREFFDMLEEEISGPNDEPGR
jgi:hypothetical protein